MWAGDVGQNEIEEVDVIERGGNYGWNRLEGDACYGASGCDARGTVAPIATYTHEFGCAIVGGYVYHGDDVPELQGWYIFGDFCTGRVWGVDAAREGPRPIIPLADTEFSLSSFSQDPDGEVYLITFDRKIEKLVRK